MAKKVGLNPLTESPKSLSDLRLTYMLNYVKAKGSKEDKEWYANTVNKYWGKKFNNISKKETDCVTDVPALRREFAERFFPNLLDRKQSSMKNSYLDLVNELIK